jgi:hypothetical protein
LSINKKTGDASRRPYEAFTGLLLLDRCGAARHRESFAFALHIGLLIAYRLFACFDL